MSPYTRRKKSVVKEFIANAKGFLDSPIFGNFVAKTIVTIIIWAVALIPVYVALGLYHLLDPVGFWQMAAFLAISVFFLGGFQVFLGFIALAMTLHLIFEQ